MKPPEPLMVVVTNLCMGGAEITALRNCEVLLEAGAPQHLGPANGRSHR